MFNAKSILGRRVLAMLAGKACPPKGGGGLEVGVGVGVAERI